MFLTFEDGQASSNVRMLSKSNMADKSKMSAITGVLKSSVCEIVKYCRMVSVVLEGSASL